MRTSYRARGPPLPTDVADRHVGRHQLDRRLSNPAWRPLLAWGAADRPRAGSSGRTGLPFTVAVSPRARLGALRSRAWSSTTDASLGSPTSRTRKATRPRARIVSTERVRFRCRFAAWARRSFGGTCSLRRDRHDRVGGRPQRLGESLGGGAERRVVQDGGS